MLLDREYPEDFDDDEDDSESNYLFSLVDWDEDEDDWDNEAEESEDDWEPKSWNYIMYGPMDGMARDF